MLEIHHIYRMVTATLLESVLLTWRPIQTIHGSYVTPIADTHGPNVSNNSEVYFKQTDVIRNRFIAYNCICSYFI